MNSWAFSEWSTHVRVADAFDIAVVTVLCYLILSWIKSHASPSLLAASIVLLAIYAMARVFDLYLTSLLFHTGAVAILLAMLLIYQEDLRRAAEYFALRGLAPREGAQASHSTVDLIVETAEELAENHVGALIVFPGQEPLERLLRGGEPLHGELSRSLLVSIFHPGSPGHDGAAVIEDNVLTRFAVHLPLSRFPEKVGREGTRHAAALGLAESSDALVVVVSEERGTISVAQGGVLETVEPAILKSRLEQFVGDHSPQPARRVLSRWLFRNPGLKAASLLLASLLWLGLAFRVETIRQQYPARIEYRNLPANWALQENLPIQARVTLSGSERDFDRFDPGQLAVSLDLSQPREGTVEIPISPDQVTGANELEVIDIEPPSLSLDMYRTTALNLPVRVRLRNDLPENRQLDRVEAQPARVSIQAPAATASRLDAIETEAIDLAELRGDTTLKLRLDLPPRVRLAEGQASTVEATVYLKPATPIEKKTPPSKPARP